MTTAAYALCRNCDPERKPMGIVEIRSLAALLAVSREGVPIGALETHWRRLISTTSRGPQQ